MLYYVFAAFMVNKDEYKKRDLVIRTFVDRAGGNHYPPFILHLLETFGVSTYYRISSSSNQNFCVPSNCPIFGQL